jgi:glycosyltransferase involved in cell wall biosynthesis
MKILHFIDEIKMGGAQTHLFTILREMQVQKPNDIQKVVVLFEEAALINDFQNIGIEVECLNLRFYFQKRSYFKIVKTLKNYIKQENPDVVETHLTWSRLLANTAAYLAGIKTRIGFEQGDIYLNSFKFRILNFFSQFFFQNIIVCSVQLKEWAHITHKISNSKLKVMYNCVDLSKFKPVEKKI